MIVAVLVDLKLQTFDKPENCSLEVDNIYHIPVFLFVYLILFSHLCCFFVQIGNPLCFAGVFRQIKTVASQTIFAQNQSAIK